MNENAQLQHNPLGAALIAFGVVASCMLWVILFKRISARMAGWEKLVRNFPPTEIERLGDTFRRQTGTIGITEFEGGVDLQLIQEGLLIRPSFARHSPILIPWSKISAVEVREGCFLGRELSLRLTVEWEKLLQFSLPRRALPVIEQNVSGDRLSRRQAHSFIGEMLKKCRKKRKQG